MIDKISNKTLMLEKALDAAWMRNETISNNIANVNTPDFKKSYVGLRSNWLDAQENFKISGAKKIPRFLR